MATKQAVLVLVATLAAGSALAQQSNNAGADFGIQSSQCQYTFSSGSGPTFVAYCVSANGTMPKLESPQGAEHIQVGTVWEGYVVCSGTSPLAWDISQTESGFGDPTVVSGPTRSGVSIRRASAEFQLDNTYKLDKKEKDVTITMALTNISGSTISDVRLARVYDPDNDNDFGDDLQDTSDRGIWARDVNAVTLTGITFPFPTDTATGGGAFAECSPTGEPTPTLTDNGLANVTYRLGNMAPGQKRIVKFVYRAE
ncbi:MAG: hypothetical protein DMF80_03735 [Acidobacteria bacterium]|nr:MAG: hypothetical protein DMF80_03735 [Acidobacteriota bacterium]